MSYIGSKPAASFAKATSQTFTGDNSDVTFTLNKRVSNPEDLEVFVSNVQQQPTTSYTIDSDGVTLRFNEAPPSGQFYVVYRNLAQQTGIDTGASRLVGNNTFTGANTFTGTQTINNRTTIIADDGVVDNNWILELHNNEATDDRSYGLKVSAGSTTVDRALDVRDHTSASNFLQVNGTGFVSRPQTPCMSMTKNISGQQQTISGTNMYVPSSLNSSYGNSHSVNNKSYFDDSTTRFTIPTGQAGGYYLCSFQTLLGIEIPSSGTNWGYIAIRKNDSTGLSNNHITEAYREVVNATAVSNWSWETLNCTGLVYLTAGQWIEPIFSGSAGIDIYIHSGAYTNFTVAQIA